MNKIEKWCNNKPYLLAIAAPHIVASSKSCYELLLKWKSGKQLTDLETPTDLDQWINLYKNHKRVEECLKHLFMQFGEVAEVAIDFFDLFKLNRKERKRLGSEKFNQLIREELIKLSPEEWWELHDMWIAFLKISLDMLENDVLGELDEETIRYIKEMFNQPEILFYIRLQIPCWLFYGELPAFLLRKARLGNIDAIEKMLRLDPSLINDAKIKRIFHNSAWSGKKSTASRISSALTKTPTKRISLKRVKSSAAGLISALAKLLYVKLTAPEIRKLFDAVAEMSGQGEIDIDLPESPIGLSKVVQHESQFWLNVIHYPDSK